MVRIDWTADARLGDGPGACPTARSRSTRPRWRCTTGRRSSRGSRPTASPTARSPPSGRTRTRRASRARRAGWRWPSCPTELFLESLRALVEVDRAWVPDRPERVAVPAAVHDRDRGRPRRAARRTPTRYLLIASPAGPYFPRGVQAGVGVAVDRVHPRRARRHRRGEVRGQLRRLAGRPGVGRRAGLRPGRLARRGRAPVGRGDGRDEPVLRVRLGPVGPHRHPRAHRHPAARRHPRLAAHPRPRARLHAPRRARSPPTSGARATRPARSPRSSPAAPPR